MALIVTCGVGAVHSSRAASATILTLADVQSLPRRGGTLLLEFQAGTRTLPGQGSIATVVVTKAPPAPVPGQERLAEGDEVFSVNDRFFDSVLAMGHYLNALPPGDNVRLGYFSSAAGGHAVSALFPLAGPNGFPSENAIQWSVIAEYGLDICDAIDCLGKDTGIKTTILGIGVKLLSH